MALNVTVLTFKILYIIIQYLSFVDKYFKSYVIIFSLRYLHQSTIKYNLHVFQDNVFLKFSFFTPQILQDLFFIRQKNIRKKFFFPMNLKLNYPHIIFPSLHVYFAFSASCKLCKKKICDKNKHGR